ncbi:MAG: hypothetical protein ACKOFJ_02390 [Actinomycetota bacterium]
MMLKKVSYLLALTGIALGALMTVRYGAIVIALATALFVAQDFKQMRMIERVIPVALIVSLITIALALPRR